MQGIESQQRNVAFTLISSRKYLWMLYDDDLIAEMKVMSAITMERERLAIARYWLLLCTVQSNVAIDLMILLIKATAYTSI